MSQKVSTDRRLDASTAPRRRDRVRGASAPRASREVEGNIARTRFGERHRARGTSPEGVEECRFTRTIHADASVSTDDPTLFSTLFYSLIASSDDLFDTFLLFDSTLFYSLIDVIM